MIKVTILIPFPLSISTCDPLNVLFSSLLFLWISSKLVVLLFHDLFPKPQQHTKHSNDTEIVIRSSDTNEKEKDRSDLVPDELWVEVLCRLPPKDIVRCKIVSKSWNALISQVCIPKITSPLHGFVILLKRGKRGGGGEPFSWDFTYTISDETHWKTNSFFIKSSSFPALEPKCFLDSSNGFLLLQKDPYLCVFNPSTHQSILLPQAPGGYLPRSAALIFDPPFSVVYILYNPVKIVVFSSATWRWVEHRDVHMDDSLWAKWNLRYVYLQGSLYNLTSSCYLAKLDIKQPSITGIKLPEIVKGKNGSAPGCIGLSKSRLHYGWTDERTNKLLVWMLDASQWVLKHTIPLLDFAKGILPGVLDDSSKLTTYAFHPTSDELFVGNTVSIFRYHPHNKKLECIYKVPNGQRILAGEVQVRTFSQNLTILKFYNRIINNAPIGG